MKKTSIAVAVLSLFALCSPTQADFYSCMVPCVNQGTSGSNLPETNNCADDSHSCSRFLYTDPSGNPIRMGDSCDVTHFSDNPNCNPDSPATVSALQQPQICGCNGSDCNELWLNDGSPTTKPLDRKVGGHCPGSVAIIGLW
jgi:hypothetical protein